MAAQALQTTPRSGEGVSMLEAMDAVRERTLALVAGVDDGDLERVLSPIMSPLAWDLGHIAAYEDLWIAHRQGGLELARPELADVYDAFETPRAVRGEIETLGAGAAREYMAAVRERTARVVSRGGDEAILEMVLRHELQHTETMRQTMVLAGMLADELEPLPDHPGWVRFEPASFEMGAGEEGFAYDNERPRHVVHVDAFEIARLPVTNARWSHFVADGGYERRELWSEEGWAWLAGEERPAPPGGHPEAAVCHVSAFEADAFARWSGARLPSEAEWERAAGELAGVGQVWEWTADSFGPYPGFRAHPYREYSEVFFGERYRVLRGGSWATHQRVASPTFRNWDLPQRRQIFAGLRLAREAS